MALAVANVLQAVHPAEPMRVNQQVTRQARATISGPMLQREVWSADLVRVLVLVCLARQEADAIAIVARASAGHAARAGLEMVSVMGCRCHKSLGRVLHRGKCRGMDTVKDRGQRRDPGETGVGLKRI